jgi:tetratricopeptide (TPR) repeat protein
MQQAVRLHDRIMREAIAAAGGSVFKTVGDAFCAAFATPESAVTAAIDAQHALAVADFAAVDGLRVRMAVNTGTADERDGDYFGPALNRVARLLSLANGEQILVSSRSAELLRENLPQHVTILDIGEHALKDIEGHERVFQVVAPELRRDFPELRSREALQPWLVPDAMHTRYFTGRDDLLARLQAQLAEFHLAALSGLGGVGKTQIAIEYAVRHRSDYRSGVFWINAETIGGLTSGFVEIAKTLGLSGAESSDDEKAVTAALAWLHKTDRWLLILDNVVERSDLERFIPRHAKGDVLLTSRESVFAELGIPRSLDVRDLRSDDAVQFLLARTGRWDDADDRGAAGELAANLGNLPLALEQAAAYIAETGVTFSAYLTAFRKRHVALLEKAAGLVTHDTVAVTWAANFDAVQRASLAAANVLRISALLAADAIPYELFLDAAGALGGSIAEALADPDDLSMAELLRPLMRYSLIRSDPQSRTFSVHRLVQEVAWEAVPEAERRTYVERAVCALDAAFPDRAFSNWAQCERLVPHVMSISGWLASIDAQPEVAGRILSRAGQFLWERGRYAEAQTLHERALTIAERALGPDHLEVARSLNDLAVVHWYQGRYAEAKQFNERALAIREIALGDDHPEVAKSANTLAIVYVSLGRFQEAQALFERAAAIRERELGPDHPDLARILINLANLHNDRGRRTDALALYERAIPIWERALGTDHPDVAATLNNLADVYADLGRHAEALPLDERALEIRERALGPDHPDLAFTLNSLGDAYAHLERHVEAESLFERALVIRERALGVDHPGVAESLAGLGNLYVEQGRCDEAEAAYDRALTIREHALGPDHTFVAQILIGMATLLAKQGKNSDAIALYERAFAIMERSFGSEHVEVKAIRNAIESLR